MKIEGKELFTETTQLQPDDVDKVIEQLEPDMLWIPGFEGSYKIDKSGNVYTFKTHSGEPRQLKAFTQMYDYNIINLRSDNKSTTFLIHILVMNTYGPPKPFPPKDWVCSHIDTNKKNNHISNLQWIKRANVKTKPPKAVKAVGIDDNDVIYFRSVTNCAAYFHAGPSQIREKIVKELVYKGYRFYDLETKR
jgi:hypothetical protein